MSLAAADRPNILVVIADDWSHPHAAAYGDPAAHTPHFDQLARDGALFHHAFVSTPSCTPSRASILTGQHHWRLEEADSLGGSLYERFPVYTDLLAAAGYHVGRYGKGMWPSQHTYRKRDSFGKRYPSLEKFLAGRKDGQPFCFWYGGRDPHRPYTPGFGEQNGIDPATVRVAPTLPDNPTVRADLADYYGTVKRFDAELGTVLAQLDAAGESDNTLVMVTGDNGMPFPRAKATLYDPGTRVPLAVRWPARVKPGRTVDDFVSLCDLAPTFLEAAGLPTVEQMTGHSLVPLLESPASGQVEIARNHALTGLEKHVYPNPSRAYRTAGYLYILNETRRGWKTGETGGPEPTYDFTTEPWPTLPGAFSHNIDPSPTKQWMRHHRDDPTSVLTFSARPPEELYDLAADPHQLTNLATDPAHRRTLITHRARLQSHRIAARDPRLRFEINGYHPRSVRGWTVLVHTKLQSHMPDKTARAMELLESQLDTIIDKVPAQAVAHLRKVPLWFSPRYPLVRPRAEYHPGARWLRDNGRNPAMAKAIEFSNVAIFEEETFRMPLFVFHELAHAYHDQVVGWDHPGLLAAFANASASGSYEKIERAPKRRGLASTFERAYAMTNDKEYFAEISEAYFHRNDFYPFDNAQLQTHDPTAHQLLKKLWGVRE